MAVASLGRDINIDDDDIPASEDTLPKLLRRNVLMYAHRPALRKKRYGIWNTYTWRDYYRNVKELTLGLISLGLLRGECVAIVGDNDPEWWYAALATMAAGGIEYGVFVDCTAEEVKYYATKGEATFIFAKDQEQVDKLLQIREQLPKVRRVIYWENKGMWAYDDPWLLEFRQVQSLGREYETAHPDAFDKSIELGKSTDIHCLCSTSGTTADPKLVMISHRTEMLRIKDMGAVCPFEKCHDYFSFLNPAWGLDQAYGICMALMYQVVVHFPEGPDTVRGDARQVAANFQVNGARAWEELSRDIRVRLADADFIKRSLYNAFLRIGLQVADLLYENRTPALWLRALNCLGDWLVFRPLRDKMGFTRPLACMVSGSLLSPELLRYFRALGLPLLAMYASTEAASVTRDRPGALRLGSLGKLAAKRSVKLSEEGELAVKIDDRICTGYYGDPDATAAKLPPDGWYYTGDAGFFDSDGFFFFIDRMSEMMVLANGSKFSATNCEARLRFSPYIKDVMVLGDGRDFVAALVNIDLGNVGQWAEKRHILYTTLIDLSQRPEVLDLIESEIARVNRALPVNSRISRFVNLHKQFDADEAELTRTRKLKRDVLERKYALLVDGIYSGAAEVPVTVEVTYRDGRTGTSSTRVLIRDVSREQATGLGRRRSQGFR